MMRYAPHEVGITGGRSGNVELALPLPQGYGGRQVQVWHCKADHVEKMTLTVSGNRATGLFSSLSPFAVFAGSGTPQTGDGSNPWLWAGLGALALAALGGLLLWRRRAARRT
ncbi:MAG: LPXTG cell wall anchor domain-containing protein [Ruminococcaceae bacterium]|nr:LPXTG cell wall anchor domain-containing protein [Oscillospiraceae bacterium]